MFLLASAFAQELPWACPEVDEPADALPLQTDAGVEELYGAVVAEARTWWDEDCDWVVWEWEKKGIRLEECVTSAGAELRRFEQEEEVGTRGSRSIQEWSVALPAGLAGWTTLSWESESYAHDSAYGGSSYTQEVAWTGSVEGVPDDGFLWMFSEYRGDYGTDTTAYGTSDCGWAYGWDGEHQFVEVGDVTVEVGFDGEPGCWEGATTAWVNGVLYGSVDATTWILDEVDRDGWAVHDGDCDDADPSAHPCAEEVPYDGVDQDCDGADDFDADDDGWDAADAGGDDCDDGDADIHPGAVEVSGDGVDQDCSGVDSVDRDGDRSGTEGDPPDCDDGDPDVHPRAPERPYDGVDQDCDGADLVDADEDGHDALEVGGDDCDDSAESVHPGAVDLDCDGLDADCDGRDPCAREGCGRSSLVFWLGLGALGVGRRRARGGVAGFR